MNNYVYSPSDNVILPLDLKGLYLEAGTWPIDTLDISDEQATEFMSDPPEGKMRVAGTDGLPVWADVPPPTQEELIADAETKRQYLIEQANEYINSKQWPGKAAMGRLKDSEKTQYNAWLDYLDELEAVDTSTAPVIAWPTEPKQ